MQGTKGILLRALIYVCYPNHHRWSGRLPPRVRRHHSVERRLVLEGGLPASVVGIAVVRARDDEKPQRHTAKMMLAWAGFPGLFAKPPSDLNRPARHATTGRQTNMLAHRLAWSGTEVRHVPFVYKITRCHGKARVEHRV